MEALVEIGVYFAKVLIVVVGIIAVIVAISAASMRAKNEKPHPEVEDLGERYKEQKTALLSVVLSEKEFKAYQKAEKAEEKNKKETPQELPRLFVIDFLKGDVQASPVDRFREEITAVLAIAKKEDSVLVNIESPGGVVHGYGLAAAQILRLREAGVHVCVSIDKVAASGGYMMACVAHEILSSPFAIVGSIGVVAQVPNFHKLLKKNEIEYKEYTAGDFKRTVSLFGEITEKGEQKFIEQLEATHTLFKTFVSRFRPKLKLEEVATGEYWFGTQALDKGLVDRIVTSDEYIQSKLSSHKVFRIHIEKKQSLSQKFSEMLQSALGAWSAGLTANFSKSGLNLPASGGFEQQKQFQVLAETPLKSEV